jgi:glycosyltransferase involved in cell wall biosynthesis
VNIACVVHRFGPEIAGGSEGHCLQIAQRLAATHDVTVLTTCAKDHVTWRNEYAPGATTIGRVRVERFRVARARSLGRFAVLSDHVFDDRASLGDQERWFRENGPESPALLDAIAARGASFDRMLFWSFRYYQTFFGLPLVADRAVLVPTAEDDPVVRLDVLDRFFSRPSGFLFLTPEEQQLVARRCSRPLAPSAIVGCGLEAARDVGRAFQARRVPDRPFALYLGRIDPNKGCETLLRQFERYVNASGPTVQLVMAGPANMPLPRGVPWLTTLGYVDDATREALLARAALLVVPSPYESLSIVLLEGWNHARPALVNGRCGALRGQAIRSGGALYYRNFDEFAAGLARLVERRDEARQIGAAGLAYVEREYRWPLVMDRIEAFLRSLPAPAPLPETALSAASLAQA